MFETVHCVLEAATAVTKSVCVCVCVRERERERGGSICVMCACTHVKTKWRLLILFYHRNKVHWSHDQRSSTVFTCKLWLWYVLCDIAITMCMAWLLYIWFHPAVNRHKLWLMWYYCHYVLVQWHWCDIAVYRYKVTVVCLMLLLEGVTRVWYCCQQV